MHIEPTIVASALDSLAVHPTGTRCSAIAERLRCRVR